jgi:peptidyl-prolyl cis-trans isomerase A (cyclophilin A)
MKKTVWIAALVAAGSTAGCDTTATDSPGTGGATSSSSTNAASTAAMTTAASSTSDASSSSTGEPVTQCPTPDTDLPLQDLGLGKDPEGGDFTMDEALAGLPEGPGPLRAIIDTELGTITCELFPESAPKGVANFVGLARGRRPWKQPTGDKHWIKGKRFYDGLIFHRVIDDFVAQGGDPLGTGYGGPGYKFPDEIDPMKSHVPGALAYANSGPNTNGSQFYIVAEVDQSGLDGGYVIFGLCAEVAVVQQITEVMTTMEKPDVPIHTKTVTITRCAP